MKGRIVLLDEVQGRKAAALMVDGRLEDILIDAEDDAPQPGEVHRAVADRPMKGQGGLTLTLGDGAKGYLRQAKGIAPGTRMIVQVSGNAEPGKATPVTPRPLFKSRYAIVTPDAPGLNISRRIKDEAERDRILEIAHEVMEGAGEGHGLILRSAAEGVDADTLAGDIAEMRDLAAAVMVDGAGGPERLLDAPDAHLIAWRDWSDPDPDQVIKGQGCFADHGVLEAVDAALSARVVLPGGASAHIEPTRALVAVDVNTGGTCRLPPGSRRISRWPAICPGSFACAVSAGRSRSTLRRCRRRSGAASRPRFPAPSGRTGRRSCWPAGRRWAISRSRRNETAGRWRCSGRKTSSAASPAIRPRRRR
jgi:ribonuclease G